MATDSTMSPPFTPSAGSEPAIPGPGGPLHAAPAPPSAAAPFASAAAPLPAPSPADPPPSPSPATSELSAPRRGLHVLGTLGHGSQACVRLARRGDGELLAVKGYAKPVRSGELDAEAAVRGAAEAEAWALRAGEGHPHLPRLCDYFESKSRLYVCMEYVAGPNLQSHLDRLGRTMPEDDVRLLVGTILGTLAFLHAKGVVHRDVKPANIVLRDAEDPSSAVLIDFGSACADPATADPEACARRSPAKVAGTPFFLPPEAFAGERCSEKTDIWSLGCLTFQLLTGTTPFADSSSLANLSLRVVASSFSFTDGCRASPAARDFIRFLLHPDPRSRPDAGKALVHPWLCPPALAQVGQGAGAAVVYCAEEGLRVLRMPGAEWDPMVAPPGADPGRVAPGAVVA